VERALRPMSFRINHIHRRKVESRVNRVFGHLFIEAALVQALAIEYQKSGSIFQVMR
jgi:hypothetical protein